MSAVFVFGAVLTVSIPIRAQLVVNYDLIGNTINMTDNAGGAVTAFGNCSQTYSEPSFAGANMENELNAVVFPVDPTASTFWAVTLNATPGEGGPGAAYVSISQMGADSPYPYLNLADAVVSIQTGTSAPGWQSFDFNFTGDVPIFTEEDGFEVQTGDNPLNYSVQVNVNFDPPASAAPVPDYDGTGLELALVLPVILLSGGRLFSRPAQRQSRK